MRLPSLVFAILLVTACKGEGDEQQQPTPDAGANVDPDDFVRALPASCAFDCKNGCPDEAVGPFVCPSMDAWEKLPHTEACGGVPSFPAPSAGKCAATAPTGEALRKAGRIDATTFVLPDGHRITPLGAELALKDDTHVGGFPVAMQKVPGTKFAIVVEAGFGDHLIRSVDLDTLAIVSTVPVDRANWGIALVSESAGMHRAYVSGGASGKIWSLTVDDATGALANDTTKTIDLGMTMGGNVYFSAGIAVTPDGRRLVTTAVRSPDARIVSLDGATYGAQLATASVGTEQFGVAIDPADAAGEVAWIALWQDAKVVAVDTTTGEVKKSVATGKNPEGMAFLDARYMVVAAADGDNLTLVDRVAGSVVATIPIEGAGALHGWSPTSIAYDSAAKKLSVAESVINAVEVFDVAPGDPPMLAAAGRIPTAWWPSDLFVDAGKLFVLEARGYGTGTGRTGKAFGPGEGEIAESMSGTLHAIPLSGLDLAVESAKVKANGALADVPGYPTVSCPGAEYDFPVPRTNTEGASKTIKHVVFVVRENKAFDGVLGDMPGVDGDAKKILSPTKQASLWRNLRGIGKTWTIGDNYYTDAEFSSQGHVWTTYGRTTDFTERVWHIAASDKGRDLGGGVTEAGRAAEGSIFEWMLGQNVEFDIMGEATGLPKIPAPPKRNPLDTQYPGIAQNVGLEDVTKACYFAARARVRCDLHDFSYVTLPNDHTFGGGSGRPTPETMIAVNDEATGMLLDALGKSPFWPETLVIITEDDPQDGGDHVDLHRTPIVFAGPWIKKGYVAKGHYDVASLVKLFAHLRGLPYPNAVVARAPLPLEMFTSTPDYATWTMLPRTEPRACNAPGSSFATEAAMWDWDDIDEQPGLGRHVQQMLRASEKERGPLLQTTDVQPEDDDG
jgi:DNA-binding beta-propeller fold protein YncE